MYRLALSSALMGALLSAVPAYGAPTLADVTAAHENCRAGTADKRFDNIRDKIGTLVGTVVANPPERKPSPSELASLRLLYQEQVRCAMVYGQLSNPQIKSPLQLQPYNLEHLSALALLVNGYGTYADYGRWAKTKSDEANQLIESELRKRDEAEQRAKAAQSTVLLGCIADNPDQARGMEFQYQINLQDRSVWASRGGGTPTGLRIGESEFSFSQGDSQVNISRLTGLFSIISGSVVVTGKCNKASARAF
jgi:hypothetical protein